MRSAMFAGIVGLTMASPVAAQAVVEAAPVAQSTAPSVQSDPAILAPEILKKDTPVELMAYSEVSTADSTPGKRFKLVLHKALTVGGATIVPAGTTAFGEVTSAVDSGGLGKSGRMTAKLLFLKFGDAEIPLDGDTSAKGTGAGSAGVAILFTGWAGFFHRGNNAKIKAGEILTGFVSEDVALDLSATPPKRVALPAASVVATPVTQ